MGDEPEGGARSALRTGCLGGAPVIIVHSLTDAVAALNAAQEAGRAVILASAPGAGIYAGPGWFREMVAAARSAVPGAQCVALLDCGDDTGAAQAAIRAGIETIVFTGHGGVAERLTDIAAQLGVRLVTTRPMPVLDLAADFFASPDTLRRRVADILASLPTFC